MEKYPLGEDKDKERKEQERKESPREYSHCPEGGAPTSGNSTSPPAAHETWDVRRNRTGCAVTETGHGAQRRALDHVILVPAVLVNVHPFNRYLLHLLCPEHSRWEPEKQCKAEGSLCKLQSRGTGSTLNLSFFFCTWGAWEDGSAPQKSFSSTRDEALPPGKRRRRRRPQGEPGCSCWWSGPLRSFPHPGPQFPRR